MIWLTVLILADKTVCAIATLQDYQEMINMAVKRFLYYVAMKNSSHRRYVTIQIASFIWQHLTVHFLDGIYVLIFYQEFDMKEYYGH